MQGQPADSGFRDFATAASPALFRSAWLLTGDWQRAEDLVQEALARMFRLWAGIGRIDNPAAYAQTVLARQFLSERRRRSSTERPLSDVPEQQVPGPDADLRVSLAGALGELAPYDRAVLVLRYLADRSVEQVAVDLGRSPGAIRIQSMRALARLRGVLGDDALDLVQS